MAAREAVDALEGIELAFALGWTLGVPIVPAMAETAEPLLVAAVCNRLGRLMSGEVRRRAEAALPQVVAILPRGVTPPTGQRPLASGE